MRALSFSTIVLIIFPIIVGIDNCPTISQGKGTLRNLAYAFSCLEFIHEEGPFFYKPVRRILEQKGC